MAPSEAFIRDRVISVFMMSDVTEVTERASARAGGRVRMNVSNVVRWKLCKRNC
jgi:hypothetical protein